jgi:hypothetical protein
MTEMEYLDKVGEYLRYYTTEFWDRAMFRYSMQVLLDRYTDPEYDAKFLERVADSRRGL